MTNLNPNVFYELGIAHTLNKKVIIITEDVSTLPFDLKSYRVKEYSTHFVKFAELIDTLKKYMYGVITVEAFIPANINNMSEDMKTMSIGITTSTSEIERVQKTGGTGTATFVRKEAKKVAKHLGIFSSKLRSYNQTYVALWAKIEKDTLGLIENRFAKQNKESLVLYLKSLKEMQGAIK